MTKEERKLLKAVARAALYYRNAVAGVNASTPMAARGDLFIAVHDLLSNVPDILYEQGSIADPLCNVSDALREVDRRVLHAADIQMLGRYSAALSRAHADATEALMLQLQGVLRQVGFKD